LLNTSFNLKDEPIVCSPEDAIDSFNRSNMDLLVLGNFVISQD
jgi:carbamoyltransferase